MQGRILFLSTLLYVGREYGGHYNGIPRVFPLKIKHDFSSDRRSRFLIWYRMRSQKWVSGLKQEKGENRNASRPLFGSRSALGIAYFDIRNFLVYKGKWTDRLHVINRYLLFRIEQAIYPTSSREIREIRGYISRCNRSPASLQRYSSGLKLLFCQKYRMQQYPRTVQLDF